MSDSIHKRAAFILANDPSQRLGQAYYNAARAEGDWLRANIDGTERDPFNADRNLPAFLEAWSVWRLVDGGVVARLDDGNRWAAFTANELELILYGLKFTLGAEQPRLEIGVGLLRWQRCKALSAEAAAELERRLGM